MEILTLMFALLLAVLLLLPSWPYSAKWGFAPASACGLMACGTAVLALLGRI